MTPPPPFSHHITTPARARRLRARWSLVRLARVCWLLAAVALACFTVILLCEGIVTDGVWVRG